MKKLERALISSVILIFILLTITSVNAIDFNSNNNTNDIQTAINNNQDTIVLSSSTGEFKDLGTINITKDNVVIRGKEGEKVIINRTTPNDGDRLLFNITGSNVIIKDLHIINYNTTVLTNNINNTTIQNLNITTNAYRGTAIHLNNTNKSNIIQNTIKTTEYRGDGVYLSYSSNNNVISNFINITGEVGYGVILSYYSSNNNVMSNYINATSYQGWGVYLSYSSNNNVSGNFINITGGTGYGVYLSYSSNNNVSGNFINATGHGGCGVYLCFISSNNNVSGNFINTTGTSGQGVYLSSLSSNNNVTSNDIIAYSAGIYIYGDIGTGSNISYNRILSYYRAIYFTDIITGNVVEANWFGTNNITELKNQLQTMGIIMNSYYIMILNSTTVNNNTDVEYGNSFSYNYYLVLNNSGNHEIDNLPDFEVTVVLFDGSSVTFNAKESKQWTYKTNQVGSLESSVLSENYRKNDALITNFVINVAPKDTKLTIKDVDGVYDTIIVLNATLTDVDDNPIDGETVLFYVNGEYVGNNTTNPDGIGIFHYLVDLSKGSYKIYAEFESTGYYNEKISNESDMSISTKDIALDMSISSETGYNKTITITGNLGISDKNITLLVNGQKIDTKNTDSNGNVSFNYTFDKAGEFTFQLVFDGDENYTNSSSLIEKITIDKVITELLLSARGDFNIGGTATLIANLSYPVANQEIIFYLEGVEIGRNFTDSEGIALWYYTFTYSGGYEFSAEFVGDSTFVESNVVLGIDINDDPIDDTEEDYDENDDEAIDETSEYSDVYANMEKTGIPIIAIVIVLLSCLGLIGKREN